MAKFKVKKGDTVKVLAGESKGSTGRIVRVMPKMNRVVVEGRESLVEMGRSLT